MRSAQEVPFPSLQACIQRDQYSKKLLEEVVQRLIGEYSPCTCIFSEVKETKTLKKKNRRIYKNLLQKLKHKK